VGDLSKKEQRGVRYGVAMVFERGGFISSGARVGKVPGTKMRRL